MPDQEPLSSVRRSFIAKAAGAIGALALGTWAFGKRRRAAVPAPAHPGAAIHSATQSATDSAIHPIFERIQGLVPEVTPNDRFYRVDKNLFPVSVPVHDWRLSIEGEVERPFSVTYDALTSYPVKEQYTTLTCISNEVGGDLVGNAKWGGIPLRELLLRAGVKEGVVDIKFEAYDQYTESIPFDKAMHPDTLVAWTMNGEPLPHPHGFPARIIVPGIYGMKNVKWLTKIIAVKEDYLGFWEQRGWSDEAVIKTMSRIDVPKNRATVSQPAYIGGIAFAGDRGIERVEVSYDRGMTWHEAQVKEALSPYTWVLWAVERTDIVPGSGTITVRATDKTGAVQTAERADPLPEGASGYHTITVTWRR